MYKQIFANFITLRCYLVMVPLVALCSLMIVCLTSCLLYSWTWFIRMHHCETDGVHLAPNNWVSSYAGCVAMVLKSGYCSIHLDTCLVQDSRVCVKKCFALLPLLHYTHYPVFGFSISILQNFPWLFDIKDVI